MIKILCVGKVKEKSMISLIDEYKKRLTKFTKIEIIEVKDFSDYENNNESLIDIVKDKEGELLLKFIKDDDMVILLDLHGNSLDSYEFAKHLDKSLIEKRNDLIYVIAGSNGFGKNIYSRANYKICLSKLTFPHNFVRLLLLEQLFRAYKINNNQIYHK